MSSGSRFRPHGLIRDEQDEQRYLEARTDIIGDIVTNPKEKETVALICRILEKGVFSDYNWDVVGKRSPAPNSNRACDLAVEYMINLERPFHVLCFIECKRAKETQPYSLSALERQARDSCNEHLAAFPQKSFVYVSTAVGAHIRLWRYQRNDRWLIALWGTNDEANWKEYKDIGDEVDGKLVGIEFRKMKKGLPLRAS